MESTEFRKSPDPTDEVHGTGADEVDTRAAPAPGPVMFDTPIQRPIPSIVRRSPSASTRPIAGTQPPAPAQPIAAAPAPEPNTSRPTIPLTAFTSLAGTGRTVVPPTTRTPLPARPLPTSEPDDRASRPTIALTFSCAEPARVPPPAAEPPAEVEVAPEIPVDIELAPAPPPKRVKRASSGATFGAGMLQAHKVRTAPAAPADDVVAPDASGPPSTFGAGMLQARKVRTKQSALPAPTDASATASTFGAGVLQTRKSRSPLVMMVIFAAVAIAALVLTYR